MKIQSLIYMHRPLTANSLLCSLQKAFAGLLLLTISQAASAQMQNTGFAYVSSGTTLYVQSSFVNASTATYQNNGSVYITGDFTNHQSGMTATAGDHYFAGSSLQTISGTQPSYFYNASFSNSSNVQLSADATIHGNAAITTGYLLINGNTLTLNGTTSFTGALKGSSTSKLTVGGSSGGSAGIKLNAADNDSMLQTLTLNRTGTGAGLTLNSNVGIIKQLVLTNGAFNCNSYIATLKSTSILNTAIVPVVGSGASITGNVTVERFIPKYASTYGTSTGNKAYRDLTPGVIPAKNIFSNWQEGGVNTNGYGTHITGHVGTVGTIDAASGLDNTNSGNASLNTYNVNASTNGSWATILSTNQNADILSPFKGYRISIRGNRTHNLAVDVPYMSTTVNLRSTGQLITGTVTYATTGVTATTGSTTAVQLAKNASNYTLIGNPYICPIDWVSIAANTANSNIKTSYTIFDPNIGTSGAYVSYNSLAGSSNPSGSQINQYIQPNQAFFVQNVAAGTQFVIREQDKYAVQDATTLVNVFGNNTPLSGIQFNLLKTVNGIPVNMDGAVVRFSNTFSNAIGREDASKITNNADNLGLNNNLQSGQYSIEGRKEPLNNDSISLRVTTVTAGTPYTLSINLTDFTQSSMEVFLKDNFLNSQVPLFAGSFTEYPFTTNSNPLSYNNRFTIKFSDASVLPINFVSVKANSNTDKTNTVAWVVNEKDADYYEVEYSADARQFNYAGKVSASGNGASQNSYSFKHSYTNEGANYYRIKAVDKSGAIKYSTVVLVNNKATTAATISIYPNPVKNRIANISLNNIPAGNYELFVYGADGRLVHKAVITHTGLSATYTITLPQGILPGAYEIQIKGQEESYHQRLIAE